MDDRERARETLGGYLILLGLGPFLIPPVIIGWQGYHWLVTADWPQLSLGLGLSKLGFERPLTSWLGLNELIEKTPLTAAAGVFAIAWGVAIERLAKALKLDW